MKTILKGDEAVEAYEQINTYLLSDNIPEKCGYFVSDDCELTAFYDKGSIIAFDTTGKTYYSEAFSTEQDAIDWINK